MRQARVVNADVAPFASENPHLPLDLRHIVADIVGGPHSGNLALVHRALNFNQAGITDKPIRRRAGLQCVVQRETHFINQDAGACFVRCPCFWLQF